MTREPTYQDWLRSIPAERRDLFAKHFEIGRARMQDASGSGSNVHGRGTCVCMRCNENKVWDEQERVWRRP